MTNATDSKKVRVYALAKEVGLASKDLLAKLQEWGYEVKSIQSTLTAEEAAEATAKVSGKGKKKAPAKKAAAKKAPAKKAAAKKTTAKKSTKKAKAEEADEVEEEVEAKPKRKAAKKAPAKKSTAKAKKKAAEPVEEPAEEVAAEAPAEADAMWMTGLDAKGFAETFIQSSFASLGVNAEVSVKEREDADDELVIVSEGLKALPNYRSILNQLVYILGKSIHYRFNEDVHYVLRVSTSSSEEDAPSLEELAIKVAERMTSANKVMMIDALNSQERRTIHTAIANTEGIKDTQTVSDGEGIFRCLIIAPPSKPVPQQTSSSRGGDRGGRGRDGGDRGGRGGDRGSRGGDRGGRSRDGGGRGGDRGGRGGDRRSSRR
jgi:predicted RNA-binding protein Jag